MREDDLFDYAKKYKKNVGTAVYGKRKLKKRWMKKALFILFVLWLLFFFYFLLGEFVNINLLRGAKVNRPVSVYTKQGVLDGYLQRIDSKKVELLIDIKAAGLKNAKEGKEGNILREIDIENVKKIEFIKEIKKIYSMNDDERKFLGTYRADVSDHKAILIFYRKRRGHLGASIRFLSWGRGKVEYLKNVRVERNSIYFLRSCRAKLCRHIGATTNISQRFRGEISADGIKIEGYYKGGESDTRWEATRK